MNNLFVAENKIEAILIIKSATIFGFIIAITFISAGRLNYWQGWIFNGLNIFFILLTYYYLFDRADLIKERLSPGSGMKSWDKIYYAVTTPFFFVVMILSALDAGRFKWEPLLTLLWVTVGMILYVIGQLIVLWAKKTNKYFSSVVRIQKDRGKKVCKDGPYSYIRHPGYFGGIIYTIATPLLLSSFWGFVINLFVIIPIIIRTYLEDNTLQKELDGYLEYTKEVKYRLIPRIW